MRVVVENELSRPVTVERIDRGEVTQRIEAQSEECQKVAARLGVESISSLTGSFTLWHVPAGNLYKVQGEATAAITQICIITGEPFEMKIVTPIRALFSLDSDLPEESGDESWDDIEPIADGAIDIGELAVQHISLNLDPYPRKPGAELAQCEEEDKPESPFAVLKNLRRDDT